MIKEKKMNVVANDVENKLIIFFDLKKKKSSMRLWKSDKFQDKINSGKGIVIFFRKYL